MLSIEGFDGRYIQSTDTPENLGAWFIRIMQEMTRTHPAYSWCPSIKQFTKVEL
jgi:uncharacterized protein YfaT (DUF1175 family)